MDMTGERRIAAPRQTVWQALNDPAVLKASIPGCESLEKLSDTEMQATAAVKVGPMSGRFSGKVHLADLDPPNGYTISGEGQGGVLGFAKGGAKVGLTDDGPATLLHYEVNAQVGGKLAQLGARLIDASAKQMADAFFDRFSTQVAGPAPAPTAEGHLFPSAQSAEVARPGPAADQSTPGRQCLRPGPRRAVRTADSILDRRVYLSGHADPDHRKPVVVTHLPATVAETAKLLAAQGYIADQELATTVHLALAMRRPLFLEGEPGTGKTEIAKVLATGLGRRLVRLQCYDGMDISAAAYEWDHARQLMAIRLAEAAGQTDPDELANDIYARKYLLARPLMSAIDPDLPPAVLLIDELDRADEPFEAFLLELLADFQVTVPEFGTVRAKTLPAVVITSNRTREVHDAIRRRCLYHWVDYPDAARERAILAAKAPGVPQHLAAQVVAFVQRLRTEDLFKLPGVAETIDWAQALTYLNQKELAPAAVDETLGVLLKYQDDIAKVRGAEAARFVADAQQAAE